MATLFLKVRWTVWGDEPGNQTVTDTGEVTVWNNQSGGNSNLSRVVKITSTEEIKEVVIGTEGNNDDGDG